MKQSTRRMYFDDPYLFDFKAEVLDRTEHEGHPALILDQTCFYPEGGGQPSDRGTINGVDVLDVVEREDRILHVMDREVEGEEVQGRVDGFRRYDLMQQHTGQHVLSQVFVELYDADTLSFHLGEQSSTVEIGLRKVGEEDVSKVEKRANEIVFQNREIRSHWVEDERIKDFPLRKPPKKTGLLRIVEVADFDYSACGGTHPVRTGEIGLIKIIRWERIRDNLRFEFLCGWRVLEDYDWKNRELRELSNRLTVSDREVPQVFERLQGDLKAHKKEIRKLKEQLINYEAGEIVSTQEGSLVEKIFQDRTLDEVRFLALSISRLGSFAVIFGLQEAEMAHIVIARSADLDIDLREIVPRINSLLQGRGGGQPSLIQSAGTDVDNLGTALEEASSWIRTQGL